MTVGIYFIIIFRADYYVIVRQIFSMKNIFFVTLVINILLATYVNAQQSSYKLEDCYQRALSQSASVSLQQEVLKQNNSQIDESISHFFPSVNLTANYERQEPVSNSLLKNIYPSEQETVAINTSQSIFNGFKDYYQYKIQEKTLNTQEFNILNEKKKLYQQVAQIFYTILINENVLLSYQNQILIDNKRKQEIQQFHRFAKIKKTDLLSIEADIVNLEMEIETTKELVNMNRHLLNTSTGIETNVKLADSSNGEILLQPYNYYKNLISNRADIMANKKQIEIASAAVKQTKGSFLPSFSLSGNYYLKRPDYLSEVNWDVQLNATLPLFAGGQTMAQVSQAVSVQSQKQQQLDAAQMQAEQEIETYYSNCSKDKKQIIKLKELVDIDQKTEQAFYNDYKNGLASITDFLQTETNFQQAKKNLDTMLYTEKLDCMNLMLSANLIQL